MNYNIGEYIGNLILNAGITQAKLARDINVPRQLLSCVISGKREMSLQLAIKLESYFSLPDGELLKMQTMQAIKKHKQSIYSQEEVDEIIAKEKKKYEIKLQKELEKQENELANLNSRRIIF